MQQHIKRICKNPQMNEATLSVIWEGEGMSRMQSINNESNLFHFQDSRKIDGK